VVSKSETKAQSALTRNLQEGEFDFDKYFNLVSEFKNIDELEPLEIKPFDP
jgi:hypothetical protein